MAKRKRRQTETPVVVSEIKPCPHCGKTDGFLKTRGAYLERTCVASGVHLKFYRSRCKACDRVVIERVEKKLTETGV